MTIANKRMFSLSIIDTDLFLDMPLSTQALYFHLSMRADDDGFIGNPKKIQRMVGSSEDDMKVLIAKRLLIPFESGVCVIKHWRIHNYIQPDRYTETFYKLEKSMLVEDNKTYNLALDTECIQNVVQDGYGKDTQVRLGKVSIELDKDSIELDSTTTVVSSNKLQPIIDKWNSLNLNKLVSINSGTNRYKLTNTRIKEYGLETVLEAIDNIKNSSFLRGQNKKGWTIKYDWFIKPNNFIKVLENNYIDGEEVNGGTKQDSSGNKKQEYDFSKYEG
ncbi:phage replication initiation protein [Clostridium botulinum]